MRMPLIAGGQTRRESGESNEVIGKQFSRMASLDIHGVESGHIVELIVRRWSRANKGKASCIDVVHFNESEVFEELRLRGWGPVG